MIFFVSHLSLTMPRFPKWNFEDSWKTWKFHLKFHTKTETSNQNVQHQVESSNLQGHDSMAFCYRGAQPKTTFAPLKFSKNNRKNNRKNNGYCLPPNFFWQKARFAQFHLREFGYFLK